MQQLIEKQTDTCVFYEGWKLYQDKSSKQYIGERDIVGETEPCRIILNPHRQIAYEGYWPHRPQFSPQVVLTGSCLYSDCWSLQFEGHTEHTPPPRPYIIGLAHDRKRIHHYLTKKKRSIRYVNVPTQPCIYQEKLLAWQVSCIKENKGIEKVLYHLPLSIYHTFIDEIESSTQRSFAILHDLLDAYGTMLKDKIQKVFQEIDDVELEFCDPNTGADGKPFDAHAADQAPYLHALKVDRAIGIEDLPQLTISATVAKDTGVTIPCRAGVLGLPHPISQCSGQACTPLRLSMDALLKEDTHFVEP